MKLQVLITTMHKEDDKLFYDMNIKTDAVIANQADRNETVDEDLNGVKLKFITTTTRGTSKNRNIAIENAFDDDLVLFSDDDIRFYDGYEKLITDEFSMHPNADAIKFNLNFVNSNREIMKYFSKFQKLGRKDVSAWGVCALVIKKRVLDEKKLFFNERFGPGTENYCGEDTIFLQEMIKKKIKFFASPVFVGDVFQDETSWFEGYTERYLITAGMVIEECYPLLAYILAVRSAYKCSKREKCPFGFFHCLRFYFKGIEKNKKEKAK